MQIRTVLIYFSCILLTLSAAASPARRGSLVLTQPDGTSFIALIQGDEFAKIKTTADGRAIVQDMDGWWNYAIYDSEGNKNSTGYKVGKNAPQPVLDSSSDIPHGTIYANASQKRMSGEPIKIPATRAQSYGLMKGLVILAEFKDIKFLHSKEDFTKMLMSDGYSENGATGSAKEYFRTQFEGKADFHFEVSDIVVLPAKREYYGANDKKGNDIKPADMIADACKMAAQNGVNFADYDTDNDGKVDNVFVFFAGEDEAEGADETSIWSHSWYLFSGAGISLDLNGKMIDRYACSSEMTRIHDARTGKLLETRLSGIGTFCHEYCHTLGLPDLYDTDYDNQGGWAAALWGCTSLMDSGNQNNQGNTPPRFNAIEKEILGICEPTIIEKDGKYTLSRDVIYRIDTDRKDEYYLMEYRSDMDDKWDRFIGGQGMLLYHIDKTAPMAERWHGRNTLNTNAAHQCADLIEADGRSDSHTDYKDYLTRRENIEGIFFPYTSSDNIPAKGTPGLNPWNDWQQNISITGIKDRGDGTVTFNIIGFAEESTPPGVKDEMIEYETFCDGAILRFETDREHTGNAYVRFGATGKEMKDTTVAPYENGKYAIMLEGLEAVSTYTVTVHFEMEGVKGRESSVSFMTKKQPIVSWPYLNFGSAKRNNNGTFVTGTRIPLKVNNSKDIRSISWMFNGKPITHEGDYYYTLEESGSLEAHIIMEDGQGEVLVKKITTSSMTLQ